MKLTPNPVEKCGGLTVYRPIKQETPDTEYAEWFTKEWEGVEKWHVEWNSAAQRLTQRGEAITFYREVEERRAA